MADYIDITLTLTDAIPTWPGDPSITLARVASLESGAPANVSRLDFGVHCGTHVDAPLHFFPEGAPIDRLDLDRLIGPCQVVELSAEGPISAAELERAGVQPDTQRLLLKTVNSRFWDELPQRFHEEFRALDASAAHWAVQRRLKLVGIDYLSIEPFLSPADYPVHRILLGAEIAVVEGLRLADVQPGRYQLMCLPLKLGGSDGAPARAVLAPLP